jgi:hypothetical protein
MVGLDYPTLSLGRSDQALRECGRISTLVGRFSLDRLSISPSKLHTLLKTHAFIVIISIWTGTSGRPGSYVTADLYYLMSLNLNPL